MLACRRRRAVPILPETPRTMAIGRDLSMGTEGKNGSDVTEQREERLVHYIAPPPSAGWIPVPDPTVRSAEMVEATKDQLRREQAAIKEILEARILAMEQILGYLRTVVEGRADAIAMAIQQLGTLQNEKLAGIQTQIAERDEQGKMTALACREQVATALIAQEKLSTEQKNSAALAAQKSEDSLSKQMGAMDGKVGLLNEQIKATMTREEVSQICKSIVDKIDGPTGLSVRVENLIARGGGMKDSWGILLAMIGAAAGLFAILRH